MCDDRDFDFQVNPFDGFHAQIQQLREEWCVLVEVMGGGETIEAHVVANFGDNRGEAERMLCLTTAICRYLNAGGSFEGAVIAVRSLATAFADYAVTFPDDWKLLTVVQVVEEPTVILANEKLHEAIVVKEDIYAERMSLEALNDQIRS